MSPAVGGPCRLVPFDSRHTAPAGQLAELHGELLPTSPLARLGRRFLERYYYRLLPTGDLIFGATAYVADEAAGFIAATADSRGFAKAGARRWPAQLAWSLGLAILRRPRRILDIWEGLRATSGPPPPGGEPEGEMLSFGVRPTYLTAQFRRQAGRSLSDDLFTSALEACRARRVRTIRAIVDADNTAAKLFYRRHDWTLRGEAAGWRRPTLELIWEEGISR